MRTVSVRLRKQIEHMMVYLNWNLFKVDLGMLSIFYFESKSYTFSLNSIVGKFKVFFINWVGFISGWVTAMA